MIKVKVVKDLENANYEKITITGHAMYDDFGKDIVCSSVSSIVTTTVNGILALDLDSLNCNVKEGNVVIDKINKSHTTKTLLDNMINLLKELENNYPDNIQVK